MLHTPGAPAVPVTGPAPSGGSTHPVLPSAPAASASTQSTAPESTITATMGEMWIHSSTTTGKAGKVTFNVTNTGAMDHWFAIMRAPVVLKAGALDPAAVLAKTAELGPGQKDTISATLAPGSYELVCLMPGHYNAGQHQAFTVAG